MGRRQYVGGANQVTLTGSVTDSTAVLNVTALIGWPTGTGPFAACINRGRSAGSSSFEEKILCTSAGAGVITVLQRGYDGTSQTPHSQGETVEVVATSVDFDEANLHVNSTTGVHGVGSTDRIVGRASTDTLTNKSIDGGANTFTNIPRTASPQLQSDIAVLTASDAQTVIDLGNRYTKTEVDNLQATQDSLHYDKTTTDSLLAAKADVATTYTKGQVDAFIATEQTARTTGDAAAVQSADIQFATYSPVITGSGSGGSLGSGTIRGRYQRVGSLVLFWVDLTLAANTSFGTGNLQFSLPVNASSLNYTDIGHGRIGDASTGEIQLVEVALSSVAVVILHAQSNQVVSGSSAAPWSWAVNDTIRIHGQYEGV